jgi:hypothetical protein
MMAGEPLFAALLGRDFRVMEVKAGIINFSAELPASFDCRYHNLARLHLHV